MTLCRPLRTCGEAGKVVYHPADGQKVTDKLVYRLPDGQKTAGKLVYRSFFGKKQPINWFTGFPTAKKRPVNDFAAFPTTEKRIIVRILRGKTREIMVLYYKMSLPSFVEGLRNTSGSDSSLTVAAVGLMHLVPEEEIDYGLSLLREAIGVFEARKGIPVALSKRAMPFFRQDTRMLVGPEMGMYVIPFHEETGDLEEAGEPSLLLELDYQALGEFCLFEDYSLLACKYDRESAIRHFAEALETEYDTFFFDEEHTGFTSASRFFSLLYGACLEHKPSIGREGKEWRLAMFRSPEEVSYRYVRGVLEPYVPVSLPVGCLRRVHLVDYRRQPLLFGTLNGFLKSKGLPAERLLNLS